MSNYSIIYGVATALACPGLDGLVSSELIAAVSAPIDNSAGAQDFEFHVTLTGEAVAELDKRATLQAYLSTSGDGGTTWSCGVITNNTAKLTGYERPLARMLVSPGTNPPFGFRLSDTGRSLSIAPPRNFRLLLAQNSGQVLGIGCAISYRTISTQLL